MSNKKRGAGRTTKQMQAAAKNSVFVWHHHSTEYPKELAKKIGRTDLKIVSSGWLWYGWQGKELSGLVIDHYVFEIANRQMTELIQEALLRVKEQA